MKIKDHLIQEGSRSYHYFLYENESIFNIPMSQQLKYLKYNPEQVEAVRNRAVESAEILFMARKQQQAEQRTPQPKTTGEKV